MSILRKGNTLGVCVHHSVYAPANNLAELKKQAALFNTWHKSKSWAETTKTVGSYPYISYHYLIALNGALLNVTDEKYVKYHAGDNFRGDLSFNLHGIAVCLTGNYMYDKPTNAQMLTLVKLIRDIEKRYDCDARIRGHKETSASATACPGTNIGTSTSGWLKQAIANVNNSKYPAPPVIPPVEPPDVPNCDEYIKKVELLGKEIEELKNELSDSTSLVKQLKTVVVKQLEAEIEELHQQLIEESARYDALHVNCNRIDNEKNDWMQKHDELKLKMEESQVEPIKKVYDWVVELLAKILKKDR